MTYHSLSRVIEDTFLIINEYYYIRLYRAIQKNPVMDIPQPDLMI